MAALKTNRVIPVMVVAFVLMGAFVFYKAASSSNAKPVVVSNADQWMRTAPKPRTSSSDTSNDTIRAIRGEVTAANGKADETLEMNKKLIDKLDKEIAEKKALESSQEEVVAEKLSAQSASQARQFDQMMARMNEMVNAIGDVKIETGAPAQVSDADIDPIYSSIEIPDGFGVGIEAGQFVSGEDLIEVFWIEPLDESINTRVTGSRILVQQNDDSVTTDTFDTTSNPVSSTNAKAVLMKPLNTYRELIDGVVEKDGIVTQGRNLMPGSAKKMSVKKRQIIEVKASYRRAPVKRQTDRIYRPPSEPVFTIPDLSVLTGAIATTSLVGRIYPDGNVVDPQYFKLIVGRDNFTANYNQLPPEIEGMIFEGFGVGDFTTRCVSGRLVAATFIFEDGTTRSIYPGDPGSRPDSGNTIGYITDRYGNPCVSGRLITDAKEYLATGSVLAFAGAYAEALRQSQVSTVDTFSTNDGSINGASRTDVTGDIGEFAAASGLSAGIDRGTRWLDEIFPISRSLIYAPSGQTVDIHLQQELRLDIASNARKIRYRKNVKRYKNLD